MGRAIATKLKTDQNDAICFPVALWDKSKSTNILCPWGWCWANLCLTNQEGTVLGKSPFDQSGERR